MGIADDDIVKVRDATDIVAVIGEVVALRKSGSRWTGLCPFHAEKSPSFSINAELGVYLCFGCQAKGDVITFVREVHHLDFVAAVEQLAGRAGIQLTYTTSGEGEGRKKRTKLVEAMSAAVDWYHDRLLHSPDAGEARGYLRSRDFTAEMVRQYKIGWAPDAWDALCVGLRLPAEVAKETGLGFLNSRNKLQDSFRGRVLFPIFDVRGDPVAFGGRILPGKEGSKYKNSASSTIYDKSEVLYGLNWAKADIVEHDEVVVCEGYTDVIGFATAGVPRAVATCGTALTDRHVATMRRFAKRIVLAFDADAAGQGAAEKFYEWEQKHELDVHVLALPDGLDPGDLARRDPDALAAAVRDAKPFLAFRLHRLLDSANLTTAEGRARAAEAAVKVIAEHPKQLVRDQYLMEVADRCRVDVDVLRTMRVSPSRPAASAPVASAARVVETPARVVLRLAVQQPELVGDLVHESLFIDEIDSAAFRALVEASTFHEAIELAGPEAGELLQRLAAEEMYEVDGLQEVGLLALSVGQRALDDLQAEVRAEWDPVRAKRAGTVKQVLGDLHPDNDEDRRRAAIDELVAFLAERVEEGA
ncbi:MAG: primase [Actinomycetota bacterium]|jgi:DNA primase|nr:primase [Actinomycetota bacterium]